MAHINVKSSDVQTNECESMYSGANLQKLPITNGSEKRMT